MKDGAHIANFLNQSSTEPAMRSQGQAIEALALDLIGLTNDVARNPMFWGGQRSPDEEINRSRADRRERLEKFNAVHLRPHTWHVELVGFGKEGPVFCDLPTSLAFTPILMFSAIQLARVQLLDRLRKCAKCERWFFARKPWADYCSTLCRKAHHRSAPGFQKKRAEYAANYYRKRLSPNQQYYKKGLLPAEVRKLKRNAKQRRRIV